MSSAGQVVGGVVGAVVGFVGSGFNPMGALYGAQIGMMAGGYLDPPKGPTLNGPRLDDLSIQTSTYGAVIPRVYGTVTVNGNLFWLENNALKETVTKKKSGGKGGGSKTTTRTYTYSATFAVGLCKGPIVGVRRIWIGPDLIYDAGSSDPSTIIASNDAAAGFHVYTGTDTQLPDARIQATIGAANTPAWRGLAYIVFYDLQLARYANSLMGAQVRVEIMQLGATYTYPYTTFSYPGARWWREPVWDGTRFVSVAYLSNHVMYSPDGLSWTELSGVVDSVNTAIGTNGAGTVVVAGSAGHLYYSTDHGLSWAACTNPGMSGYFNAIGWNGTTWLATADTASFGTSTNGITWTAQTPPVSASYASTLVWSGQKWIVRPAAGTGRDIWTSSTGTTGSWTKTYTMLPTDANNFSLGKCLNGRVVLVGAATVASVYQPAAFISDDHGATWALYPCPMYDLNGFCVDDDNFWINKNGDMRYSPDGINWTTYAHPVNPNHFGCGSFEPRFLGDHAAHLTSSFWGADA